MPAAVAPSIEQQLRRGGRPAWLIARDLGVSPTQVYTVARRIGVKPPRPKRGEGIAAFPPRERFRPRAIRDIQDDLHDQLAGMLLRFRRQVAKDRLIDPIDRLTKLG